MVAAGDRLSFNRLIKRSGKKANTPPPITSSLKGHTLKVGLGLMKSNKKWASLEKVPEQCKLCSDEAAGRSSMHLDRAFNILII